VGAASLKQELNADGSENSEQSRRVAFRIVSNAEAQILTILQESW